MPWVRLDDHFDESPKIAAASDGAFRLYVNALAYANRTLSDGFVPALMLRRLSTAPKPERDAAALVRLGLWEITDDGWLIHDFHDYQPSKAQVLEDRRKTAERVKNWRNSKKDAESNAVTNTVSHPVGNAGVTPSPYPYPVPVPMAGVLANGETGNQQVNGVRGRGVTENRGATLTAAADEDVLQTFSESDSAPIPDSEHGNRADSGEWAESEQERPSVGFPLRYGKLEHNESPAEPDYLSDAPEPDTWGDGWDHDDEPAPADDESEEPDPVDAEADRLEALSAVELAAYRAANPQSLALSLYDIRTNARQKGAA